MAGEDEEWLARNPRERRQKLSQMTCWSNAPPAGQVKAMEQLWEYEMKAFFTYLVVADSKTDKPQLQRIRDLAGKYLTVEDIAATEFIIEEDHWRTKTVTDSYALGILGTE